MEKVFAVDIATIFSPASAFPTFGDFVTMIVRNAFVLAGVISFLILVIGGFSVIMGAGAGDTKKLESGRKAIVGAVIGLLIVVTSYWIVQVLGKITGLDLLNVNTGL